MADEFQEKTEQATPKHREKAREEGQVAISQEANSAAMLFFGLLILYFASGYLYNHLMVAFKFLFSNLTTYNINVDSVRTMYITGVSFIGKLILPIAIPLMVVGFSASASQVGLKISPKAARPKMSKLNPLSGFKRIMVSKRSLEELIKNIVKITVVLYVAYKGIVNHLTEFSPLLDYDNHAIFVYILKIAFEVCIKIAMVFIVIGAADYAFQKWEHENQLKMTKQQVKDEMKESEGDPKIKAAIKRKQMEMAMRRMMQEVPKADVVITNPTHFAVALKYEISEMDAPKVVAKGQDLVAQKIKEVAKENDVPIVENPPLARALYEAVEVEQPVPEEYFQAVAEVLAFVYKLKNKTVNL